jgi:hypothetical protein
MDRKAALFTVVVQMDVRIAFAATQKEGLVAKLARKLDHMNESKNETLGGEGGRAGVAGKRNAGRRKDDDDSKNPKKDLVIAVRSGSGSKSNATTSSSPIMSSGITTIEIGAIDDGQVFAYAAKNDRSRFYNNSISGIPYDRIRTNSGCSSILLPFPAEDDGWRSSKEKYLESPWLRLGNCRVEREKWLCCTFSCSQNQRRPGGSRVLAGIKQPFGI